MYHIQHRATGMGGGLGRPFIIMGLAAALLLPALGCQEAPGPGETYRKVAVALPIFEFENTEGVLDDGTTWRKEKGNAICWLSTWEREKRYDKEGYLIFRKEQRGFFPLYGHEEEETKEYKKTKGAVLIFPYESYRTKSTPAN